MPGLSSRLADAHDTVALGDLQLAVMRVLWERADATAAEVQSALATERPLGITTISTTLQRLEKRGMVAHMSEARVFVYRASVGEAAVRRSMLKAMIDTLFVGDRAAVVTELLSARDLSADDRARIRALVTDHTKSAPRQRDR